MVLFLISEPPYSDIALSDAGNWTSDASLSGLPLDADKATPPGSKAWLALRTLMGHSGALPFGLRGPSRHWAQISLRSPLPGSSVSPCRGRADPGVERSRAILGSLKSIERHKFVDWEDIVEYISGDVLRSFHLL